MSTKIKDQYDYDSISKVANDIKSVYQEFDIEKFLSSTLDETWETLELKERIRKISENLGKYLPIDFIEAVSIIDKIVMNYGTWLDGFCAFFPIYVELYGQDEENWDIAMKALTNYTSYASSEFAVRSFIIKNQNKMLQQMIIWSKSENEDIRRLSSEGCRPQLPWGQALNELKKDASPILPILEQLKNDPSEVVRRSVANNINDISKTQPELVICLAKDWYGENENVNKVIKHGCRTLLKKGNPEILALFGYGDASAITVTDLTLQTKTIAIGESITFMFTLHAKEETKVRLEYAIDYMKANGKHNRKIFKISEFTILTNQTKKYVKKHSFKDVSVRKHYVGEHFITLIINGKEQKTLSFVVKE